MFACHQYAHDLGEASLRDARQNARTGREKLEIFLRSHILNVTGELGASVMLMEIEALRPEDRAVIVRRRDKLDQDLRDIVAEGIRDGSLKNSNPKLVGFFVMGVINWIAKWYSPDGPVCGERIADEFVDYALNGLRS